MEMSTKMHGLHFSGCSPEAVEFFQDLQADNTKAFWSAHKDFYEASVREPMAELLDELSGEFGPGRIARPYRDVRFRGQCDWALRHFHPPQPCLRLPG